MERNMDESRKQFERWINSMPMRSAERHRIDNDRYRFNTTEVAWKAWTASRAALDIELTPICWRTYYPDTYEETGRAHSQSNERCARRIASEIGGYVVPVYHGNPQNCAAGIKVKE